MSEEYKKNMQVDWEPNSISDVPDNPFSLFSSWFADAKATEPVDPNAMALATVDADGTPSVRMVLLKDYDEQGFVFFTNRESRKGQALAANPVAALLFYWKSLGRQIRIEGPASLLPDSESDDYYNSRPRGSRIGAWASQQSRPLENREALKSRVTAMEEKFPGDEIPRPTYWGGTRITPQRIEFWHEGLYRLHSRIVYTRTADGWQKEMLYP